MDKIIELCDKVLDSIKENNKCLEELKQVCDSISRKYKNDESDGVHKCVVLTDMALIELSILDIIK